MNRAMANIEANSGRIANQGNSETEGVGVVLGKFDGCEV